MGWGFRVASHGYNPRFKSWDSRGLAMFLEGMEGPLGQPDVAAQDA